MQRSEHEVICPKCAAGYVLPKVREPAVVSKKRMVRCGNCQAIFVVNLKATSAYPSPTSRPPQNSFIMGQSVGPRTTPPPAPVSRATTRDTLPPFPRKANNLKSTISYRHRRNPSTVPPIPARRNDRWTPPPSRPTPVPRLSPPKIEITSNRIRLGDATPMGTEIADALKSGSFENLSVYKKHKVKKMMWLTGSIVSLCFFLIVPAVVLSPNTAADESISAATIGSEEEKPAPLALASPANISTFVIEPALHTNVTSGNKYHAKKSPIFIVNGSVVNTGLQPKTNILIEGELLDEDGKVLHKTAAPCGVLHRYKLLARTPRESIGNLYQKNGKHYNCSLESNRAAKFQLIFDQLPDTIDRTLTVRVKARSQTEKMANPT